MFSPFKFLQQKISPFYLGVDIGTTSIKVVEVKPGKNLPQIVNYAVLESSGYLTRANKVLQTSGLKIFEEEVIDLLRLTLDKMKPKATEVLATLPVFSVFMAVLDFPEMSAKELSQAIVFQAQQYIPIPLSEVAIDWLKVGELEDEKGFKKQQVLLIAVPQEQIRKYKKIFGTLGLNLKSLEIESLSLARALVGNDSVPTIIIDIGSRSTNIVFVEKGHLKFNSQTDFAGFSLTQAVSNGLGINPIRAEELKKSRGIVGTGPDYELSTIMIPFLDVIINEVKKAWFNYENQFPRAPKIERAILSGGGANLLGIEKYFEKNLGIPTVKAAPFVKFEYLPEIEPFVPELGPNLAVALGSVLKEFM